MPRFKIERTEFVKRTWFITSADEDSALDEYLDEDPESESYAGHPDVRIETV